MARATSRESRAGFLCFQFGVGAFVSATVWLWLAEPGGDIRSGSLLLPLLFGFAVPALLGWIPLTVASPFFAAPAVRRLIGWVPAAAAVILLIGRQFAYDSFLYEDDLVLATGMAGIVFLTVIVFAAAENTSHTPALARRGTAALTAWMMGAAITAAGSAAAGVSASFVISALALGGSGVLLGFSGRPSRSPWIPAERSIGRFARLADLLRTERKARDGLLLFAGFFGLTLSSLAWLPVMWATVGHAPGAGFRPWHLGLLLAALVLGAGMGSLRDLCRLCREWRAARVASCLVLGSLGAFVLLAFEPATAAGAAWLIGLPLGMMARLCREEFLSAFGRRGTRLPGEIEALFGTILGLALLIVGGPLAIAEWAFFSPLPPTLLMGAGFVLVAFLCWRRGDQASTTTGEDKDKGDESQAAKGFGPPEAYAPGLAPEPATPFAGDGRAVTLRYDIPEENGEEFREAIARLGRIRRREGALQWRLSRNLEHPSRHTESYLLESWSDYQEAIRHESEADRAIKQRVFDLNDWESLPHESHEALEEI